MVVVLNMVTVGSIVGRTGGTETEKVRSRRARRGRGGAEEKMENTSDVPRGVGYC